MVSGQRERAGEVNLSGNISKTQMIRGPFGDLAKLGGGYGFSP